MLFQGLLNNMPQFYHIFFHFHSANFKKIVYDNKVSELTQADHDDNYYDFFMKRKV